MTSKQPSMTPEDQEDAFFSSLVNNTPRLTVDRLNNEACLDLAEYVLKDISHDIRQSLNYIKRNLTDIVGIIRCREMLDLLNSDYYFGLSFGHSAEVAEQYENNLIGILGYDPSMAYDMTAIFDHIIKRERDGSRFHGAFNVVIPCWDSKSNELIFVFPVGLSDYISNEPNKHVVNVANYDGYDFVVYGNYYGYLDDPNDMQKKITYMSKYKHFLANKGIKRYKGDKRFKVSYMKIGGII